MQGEAVALDVERGLCFGFNSVASRIWVLIENPMVISDLCSRLCDEYDVPIEECEKQVLGHLEQLRSEGMAHAL